MRGTAPSAQIPILKPSCSTREEQQGIVFDTFGTHYVAFSRGQSHITLGKTPGAATHGHPFPHQMLFVIECVIFGPFALHHYLACANTKQLEHLSGNRVAWLVLHSGEMLHGVGALLVLFVVLNALIINEVSTIELEIVLLAHSLWLGTIIAFWPLAKDAAILHIPLWCGAVWKSKFYGALTALLDGVAMPVPRRSTEPGRTRHCREMTS